MRPRTLLLAASCIAAACSDGTSPVEAVALVTVTPDSASVELFDTLRLHAIVRDARGNVLHDRVVAWSSSHGSVYVDQGLIYVLYRGSATIIATAEGKNGSARIVAAARIGGITLTPDGVLLGVGDTLRLHATIYGRDGGPPTDSALTWASTDTLRATVSATGLVTGKGAGVVAITATAGTVTDAAGLTVVNHVASVTITPADTSLFVNDLVSLVTIARGPDGDTLTQWQETCPTPGCRIVYPVTLESLDTTIAQFVGCCTLQGRSAGIDTIVATADGVSGRAILRVLTPIKVQGQRP